MNESEARAEYIDPVLKLSGWGEAEASKVDYILVYKNR
ncbi:MAG: hypothetical protein UR22_C0001G0133 [Parcubacteria group bacterium GW2011_GWC2_32_10]|nr:MAG: hypothetical protein UR22_C0001G0133 [Parcubacteria group bacterium GW2011_GWC2_32_10]